jgi:hypothetical protein
MIESDAAPVNAQRTDVPLLARTERVATRD